MTKPLPTAVQRHQLTTPILLFLAAHRPLTFVTGQLFYALAPLCALFGWEEINEWAALLSAPDASHHLTRLFEPPVILAHPIQLQSTPTDQVE